MAQHAEIVNHFTCLGTLAGDVRGTRQRLKEYPPVIKSEQEFWEAVRSALHKVGLAHAERDVSYRNYVLCAELVGDGDIVAERLPNGGARVFVSAARVAGK